MGAERARSGRGAGAGRAGPGDTCGLGPGAFFLPTDAQTARQSPAPSAQVLGFPSPRVPFGPSCGSRAGTSGPRSRGPGWGVEVANWLPCSSVGAPGSEGLPDEARGWGWGGGYLWRSDLGLCARGDVQRHLWSRGPEPPVHRSQCPLSLSVPRCGQLSPNLGLQRPLAIRICFENVRFLC